MKKLKFVVLAVIMIAGLTSCASIVSDEKYPVLISSEPSDAKITIVDSNNKIVYKGITPALVTLDAGNGFFKKASYTITFEKQGYDESIYKLTSSLDGWYWGNVLLGSFLGMIIIDPLTGAMWKLDTNVAIELMQNTASINIMSLDDIPVHWLGHLTRLC